MLTTYYTARFSVRDENILTCALRDWFNRHPRPLPDSVLQIMGDKARAEIGFIAPGDAKRRRPKAGKTATQSLN
jgi:hypothetical protein